MRLLQKKPHECEITFKHVHLHDVGLWHCAYNAKKDGRTNNDDALIPRKISLHEKLEIFDSFNVTSTISITASDLKNFSSPIQLFGFIAIIFTFSLLTILFQLNSFSPVLANRSQH